MGARNVDRLGRIGKTHGEARHPTVGPTDVWRPRVTVIGVARTDGVGLPECSGAGGRNVNVA